MHIVRVAVLASLICPFSTVGARADVRNIVHERRDSLDGDWEVVAESNPLIELPVKIALKQSNLEYAEKYIMDVADPLSPNFGKHWSPQKVADTFRPTDETIEKVMHWLEDSGIQRPRTKLSAGQLWVNFNASVQEVERLLHTKYYYYTSKISGQRRIGCDLYSIPQDLRAHIEFITPTIQMYTLERLQPRPTEPTTAETLRDESTYSNPNHRGLTGLKNCASFLTIECLRAIYKFPAGRFNHKSNAIGIAEFNAYLYRPDLKEFFKTLTKPRIPSDTYPDFISIDGGKTFNESGVKNNYFNIIEPAIDVQLAYSIVYPQVIRMYQIGDGIERKPLNPFDLFLDALDASFCHYRGGDGPTDPKYPDQKKGGYKGKLQCGGAHKSSVYSISYAQIEARLTPLYKHRQCYEYMKMGLMGASLLFSSGDSGVSSEENSNGGGALCLAKHSNKSLPNGTRFNPRFPSSCPYVTSVGGTQLLHLEKGKNGKLPIFRGEKAITLNFSGTGELYSGGGFSNTFQLPAYQKHAVTHYLKKYPPPYSADIYNSSGKARAYPDVAAFAYGLAIVFQNKTDAPGGGTSASAPIVASIVNLLNGERLNAGKGPIGFLNPVFYAHPEAFNDITVGHNPGCGTRGFACAPGWDPVTGLGSPDFQKLKKIFLELP